MSPEGKIKLHYTTLSMVSNLFEILKAMQIPSDEGDFAKILDFIKEEGGMKTFVKLNCSLLNPSTETARK
jgi:hypothetical protein